MLSHLKLGRRLTLMDAALFMIIRVKVTAFPLRWWAVARENSLAFQVIIPL
jgi:hypothetical protein